jgi:methionyl-tRNA synthetase
MLYVRVIYLTSPTTTINKRTTRLMMNSVYYSYPTTTATRSFRTSSSSSAAAQQQQQQQRRRQQLHKQSFSILTKSINTRLMIGRRRTSDFKNDSLSTIMTEATQNNNNSSNNIDGNARTKKTIMVTTPIYYVNDKPHIGHVYTSTVADIYARYKRLQNDDVFFLTGTDEHGLKVEQSAEKRKITPKALADENSAIFRDVMKENDISFDDFIRTTDERHTKQVQSFVEKLLKTGDVYLGKFEGWYDEGQEEYYTETKAKENNYESPISGKPMVRMEEENYYFKLSKYQDKVKQLLETNDSFLTPKERKNELLQRVNDGLNDVPISRTNFTWGIPMPGDEKHVIYVWIDALMNYITAIGMAEENNEKQKYWPASVHVMAKEISWFHAVIWPAVLMALDLPIPSRVHAHGFWIREGRKMSKSLGNFVDLTVLNKFSNHYGMDGFRYYLATEGPIGAQDANFASSRVQEVYGTDLVNTFGNSTSRTTAMCEKYFDGFIPEKSNDATKMFKGYNWKSICKEEAANAIRAYENLELNKATQAAMRIITKVDLFITETEPFRMAKDPNERENLGCVLYQCLEALRIAACILEPVLPNKVKEMHESLPLYKSETQPLTERVVWGGLQPGMKISKLALFPRVDELNENGENKETETAAAAEIIANKKSTEKKTKTKVEKVYSPETQALIDAQGQLIRSMKESGRTNEDLEVAEAVKKLKELKASSSD